MATTPTSVCSLPPVPEKDCSKLGGARAHWVMIEGVHVHQDNHDGVRKWLQCVRLYTAILEDGSAKNVHAGLVRMHIWATLYRSWTHHHLTSQPVLAHIGSLGLLVAVLALVPHPALSTSSEPAIDQVPPSHQEHIHPPSGRVVLLKWNQSLTPPWWMDVDQVQRTVSNWGYGLAKILCERLALEGHFGPSATGLSIITGQQIECGCVATGIGCGTSANRVRN